MLVAVVGRDSGGTSGWDGVLGGSTSDRKCLTDSLDDERARFVRRGGGGHVRWSDCAFDVQVLGGGGKGRQKISKFIIGDRFGNCGIANV